MPRIADVPCAMCNTLMMRGPQTLAEGYATCRPCRSANRRAAPKPPCSTHGCSTRSYCKGLCTKHYQQMRNRGGFDQPRPAGAQHHCWQGDDVTYRAVHTRLEKSRGKAADQTCTDCRLPATEWSYDGGAAVEQRDSNGRYPYSTDLSHYQPRCTPCHQMHDRQAA